MYSNCVESYPTTRLLRDLRGCFCRSRDTRNFPKSTEINIVGTVISHIFFGLRSWPSLMRTDGTVILWIHLRGRGFRAFWLPLASNGARDYGTRGRYHHLSESPRDINLPSIVAILFSDKCAADQLSSIITWDLKEDQSRSPCQERVSHVD